MRAFGWGDAREYMMADKAKEANWREIMRLSLLRSGALIGAITIFLTTVFLFLALATYSPSDPSFNTSAGSVEHNWMGIFGSYTADLLLLLIGLPVILFLPMLLVLGNRLWRDIPQPGWKQQLLWCLLAALLVGTGLALWFPEPEMALPSGLGGLSGMLLANGTSAGLNAISASWSGLISGILIALTLGGGLVLGYFSLRLDRPLFSGTSFKIPTCPFAKMSVFDICRQDLVNI